VRLIDAFLHLCLIQLPFEGNSLVHKALELSGIILYCLFCTLGGLLSLRVHALEIRQVLLTSHELLSDDGRCLIEFSSLADISASCGLVGDSQRCRCLRLGIVDLSVCPFQLHLQLMGATNHVGR
jgi:hypothetical protein